MVASINNNIWPLKIGRLPIVLCVTLVLPFVMAATKSAGNVNIITEIERVLKGNNELNNVVEYLKLSEKEILQALAKSQTGTGKSFTFFAPTDWAFISMLPQDIFDPFRVDAQLRETTLLHHFVRGSLTKEDLLKSTELVMADQKASKLNRIATDVEINGAKIELTPIPLGSNLGVVYIIDRVFTTHDAIGEAISRHPNSHNPFNHPLIPPPNTGNDPNVESQTVVVDLVAELLREEGARKN